MPPCSGAGSVKRAYPPTCDSGSCPTPQAVREAPALRSIPRAQPAKEERETTTLAFYIKMHALSNRCITQHETIIRPMQNVIVLLYQKPLTL